jgi:hypothetical protein
MNKSLLSDITQKFVTNQTRQDKTNVKCVKSQVAVVLADLILHEIRLDYNNPLHI